MFPHHDDDDRSADPAEACTRCRARFEDVHPDPRSFCVVFIYSPLVGSNQGCLCADCLLKLGEFMCPEIRNIPEWVSEYDQWEAHMREQGRRE